MKFMSNLQDKRVVVMGLGRFGGGVGAARFCCEQGADVLVTDLLPADELQTSVDQLKGLPIEYRLGEHNVSDFTTADLIVVNPAVPRPRKENRFLRAAEAADVALTSEIQLLIERLPNRLRTIGVTGTAGKSTTVAMIGHALQKLLSQATDHKPQAAYIGGNIGGSLLADLPNITANDWVVLELSSFMLEDIEPMKWSPHIAIITNFSANHLDQHGTIEAYRDAKQIIFEHQREEDGDIAIGGPGVHNVFLNRVSDFSTWDDGLWRVNPPIDLLLPGDHNQLNARLAGMAIESAIDVPEWDTWQALADFRGLPHRLQFVCERDGVKYYNDSKSTTPAAAMLAIDSFPPASVHLIAGGYDKQTDLTELAQHAASKCAGIYTIGTTGPIIANGGRSGPAPTSECETLDRALEAARGFATSGQVILLSPGCASWDQFDHYEQRGELFCKLVQQ